jgi:thiamine biosynthesis lipoprotein
MGSCWPVVERARALLGTYVSVRLRGLGRTQAEAALDAAWEELAHIQALMSFHDSHSDVARLNRGAHRHAVRVDGRTWEVLAHAQRVAAASEGTFDITVAPLLVTQRRLPAPARTPPADARASWRDIELLGGRRVRFARRLWIDLGGIAKGYAVDRAVGVLAAFGPTQLCVNAGGDLRTAGPQGECVQLAPRVPASELAQLQLTDGSVASSGGLDVRAHIDAGCRHRRPVRPRTFAAVVAPLCIHADALTKVVLARGLTAGALLRRFGATALLHHPHTGWHRL